jgi:predicted ArsR family transcriptional regulator
LKQTKAMQTTRQRILQYLEKNRQASAAELSQVLNLTQANIRHHLTVLEQDGRIEAVGEIPAGGRGRPTLIYMAARGEQSNALDVLSSLLLQQAQSDASPHQQQEILEELAKRLAGSALETGSITLRLSRATQYLNEYHYKAHWEAHADAPYVFLNQCPFAQIITQHPELCQMDKYLLQHLTGMQVEQVDKQTRRPQGPEYCRFIIS